MQKTETSIQQVSVFFYSLNQLTAKFKFDCEFCPVASGVTKRHSIDNGFILTFTICLFKLNTDI